MTDVSTIVSEVMKDLTTPRPMKFCILGAAGFVAPRHMEAIRKIGGEIVAAVDPNDAVGVLDKYAPTCRYFRHFETFLPWLKRQHGEILVVVATPNDLHVGQALAVQECGHVPIVEKPVGLTLEDARLLLGSPAYAVLQMRYHPEARRFVMWGRAQTELREVQVRYNAPRGEWFHRSWKGDDRRSGGVTTNIGIHVLDLLGQAFGEVRDADLDYAEFERASVWCEFTTDPHRPVERKIICDGANESFDFSDAVGLHDEFYRHLLAGDAPTVVDALASVDLAERLR